MCGCTASKFNDMCTETTLSVTSPIGAHVRNCLIYITHATASVVALSESEASYSTTPTTAVLVPHKLIQFRQISLVSYRVW